MANYSTLKEAVADVVKTNGTQAITGANLQAVLLSIINSIGGGGYIFAGVATPSTNPGTPDQNVFYIGGAGTYANFGTSVTVPVGSVGVFRYNGSWSSSVLKIFTEAVASDFVNPDDSQKAKIPTVGAIMDGYVSGVYDVSARNGGATFASLGALLSDADLVTLIPTQFRHGGMEIRFMQTSDNKYAQYLYHGTSIDVADFTNVANWEKTNLEEEVSQLGQELSWIFSSKTDFGGTLDVAGKVKQAIKSIVIYDPQLTEKKLVLRAFGINDVNNKFQFIICDTTDIGDDVVPPSSGSGVVDSIAINDSVWTNYRGIVRVIGSLGKIEVNVDFDSLKETQPWLRATTTYNNGAIKNFLVDYSSTIQETVNEINKQIAPLNAIKKFVSFNGTSTTAVLNSPIILENNGDSIELNLIVGAAGGAVSANGSYAFCYGGSTSGIGIGVNKTNMAVRADDGTWVVPTNLSPSPVELELQTIKILYSDNKIYTYRNGELVYTYNGLKKLSLLGFGYSKNDSYGYWEGAINNEIKANNSIVSLIDNSVLSNHTVIYPNGFLTDAQASELGKADMFVSKSADLLSIYKYIPALDKYIEYPMYHYSAAYAAGEYPSFYNIWRLQYVSLCSYDGNKMSRELVLFRKGEAELAIRVLRGDDASLVEYVGGSTHGFENIKVENGNRNIQFVIDNQFVGETDVIPLTKVHSIEIIQRTEMCQAYSNSNPFADVLKHWRWSEDGEFSVTTKVEILRNISISNAMFGMMCTFRHSGGNVNNPYLTSMAMKENHPFTIFNIEDGWEYESANTDLRTKDHDCNKITLCGELELGFSMKIADSTIKPNGGMFVGTNSTTYNKIYFDLTGAYDAVTNDILSATQVWMIQ